MKGSKVSRRHFLKHGTSSVAATIAATALARMGVNPPGSLAQERRHPRITWR
jgi:hypothetical protein